MLDGTDAHDEKCAGVLSVENYMACSPIFVCMRAHVVHKFHTDVNISIEAPSAQQILMCHLHFHFKTAFAFS